MTDKKLTPNLGPVAKIEAALDEHGTRGVSLAEDGTLLVPDRGIIALALRYFYLAPVGALVAFLGQDDWVEELRARAEQEWTHRYAPLPPSPDGVGESTHD